MSSQDGLGIVCVVFSKDRPLQVDATLRSLRLNCTDLGSSTIRVLYTTSHPRFAAPYRVVASEHPDIEFVREVDFKSDLVRLVGNPAHVLFLVDDTVFVRPLSVATTIRVLDDDPACLGFSFRLGRNTTYCYPADRDQRLPPFRKAGDDLLSFDWTQGELDFGYPLEVSSSLYRTGDLLPLLTSLDYHNPNTLESVLDDHAHLFRPTRPRLGCYDQSVAFSAPVNLTQTAWPNRVGSDPLLSTEALAEMFSRGQRLDVERYAGFVANACHQELEFAFEKDPSVPTVSVVTPCYEHAQFLPDAVASVIDQTFTDWELIIVDDGSPDDTANVAQDLINRHPGRRIRLLRGPSRGLSGARNTGIAAALGRYILPLDADDAIAPTMLERTVDVLEQDRTVAIVYTDLQEFGEGTDLVRAADFNPTTLPEANQLSYCSLYRREVWEAVGGYNSNMLWGYEDWDFWVGAVERGYRARRMPEPLFLYRGVDGRYANAVRRDSELRRQMTLNHPHTYRPSGRLMRRARTTMRSSATRLSGWLANLGPFIARGGR